MSEERYLPQRYIENISTYFLKDNTADGYLMPKEHAVLNYILANTPLEKTPALFIKAVIKTLQESYLAELIPKNPLAEQYLSVIYQLPKESDRRQLINRVIATVMIRKERYQEFIDAITYCILPKKE